MMFKRWLMAAAAGPWQSGSWAALLAMLAVVSTAAPVMLLSPVLFVASGGVVALTALRQELGSLWRALVIAAIVLLVAGYVVGIGGSLVAVVFAVFWAPVFIAARGLRRGGFSRGVQVVVLLAVVLLLLGHQSGFQPTTFLDEYLETIKQQVAVGVDAETNIAKLAQLFGWLERYFWGWISASFGVLWMMSLLLGRYWHAMLDNPGAFAREFEALRLGLMPVLIALVVAVAGVLGGSVLAWEVMALVLFGVFWQGFACLQAIFRARNVNRVVWIAFYCLLIIFALQVALVLVLIGLLDNLFDFRTRLITDGG